jgi:transposase
VAHGNESLCEPYRDQIMAGVEQGLSGRRIHQDLVADHGFGGAYNTVKRYLARLNATVPLPFRRMETLPAEEMQVDFGMGAWVQEPGSKKRRRPHVFRAVLSYSRKGYSEAVWRQDTESFLRCIENAFRRFGGVTPKVVSDNLKAAVLRADWFDPELNPKLAQFALHYATVIVPTKPAMPRHKGKIESGVNYVQENALRGRTFGSLAEQNAHLENWERNIADKRIHGTIRQQVGAVFEKNERPALQPLPASLFPSFVEAKRMVHRDGFVEYAKAYYSVPPECVGRQVWVRAESRVLRVYTLQMRPLTVHALVEPGRFATQDGHIHPHKRNAIEKGAQYLLERCALIGPGAGGWAKAMYANRGPMGVRVMQGLLHLAKKHPVDRLEAAAMKACEHGCWRLRDVRRLMDQGDHVVQVDFLEQHELIRDLSAYRIEGFCRLP